MRFFDPDSSDLTSGSSRNADTGMDSDPTADEEVINQQAGEKYPKPVEKPAKITPEDLSESIAYALDGSGPGPTKCAPQAEGHKVISEGITGANLEEEEEALWGKKSK
ncbi:hypothetical protein [Spirosoma pomorum]